METTNIDKAFELLNKLDFEDGKFEITDALIEMAEWKKKQVIDKVCKLLDKYLFYLDKKDDIIDYFKKALEDEG